MIKSNYEKLSPGRLALLGCASWTGMRNALTPSHRF
jgi:hypothetical protein